MQFFAWAVLFTMYIGQCAAETHEVSQCNAKAGEHCPTEHEVDAMDDNIESSMKLELLQIQKEASENLNDDMSDEDSSDDVEQYNTDEEVLDTEDTMTADESEVQHDEPTPLQRPALALADTGGQVPPTPKPVSGTICADEGGICKCQGTVYYGKKFRKSPAGGDSVIMNFEEMLVAPHKILPGVKHQVRCNEFHLGSLLPNVTKSCWCYEQEITTDVKLDADWATTSCADENQFCQCTGHVFYGKKFVEGNSGELATFKQMIEGGLYKKVLAHNAIKCNKETLGSPDPHSKKCWCRPADVFVTNCGRMGEPCTCTNRMGVPGTVYFGQTDGEKSSHPIAPPFLIIKGGPYMAKSTLGTITCDGLEFGGDPLPGRPKQCACVKEYTQKAKEKIMKYVVKANKYMKWKKEQEAGDTP